MKRIGTDPALSSCLGEIVVTIKEVVKILEENSIDYVILDDPEFDPIEVLFFLENVPETLKNDGNRFTFTYEGRKRVIVLQTFKEAGLADWYRKKKKNGFDLSSEDTAFLWMNVAYCLSNRASWLRGNIISGYMKRFNIDEKGVEDFFVDYTLKNNVKIGHANNTVYSRRIGKRITFSAKAGINLYKKMSLLRMRTYFRLKFYRIGKDKKHSTEAFTDRLIRENVINADSHDSKGRSLNSNSGGNIYIFNEGEKKSFIKGNEPGPVQTIKNEVTVQKRIIESKEDKDCFVLMERHADDYSWVKYPFVPYDTLDDHLKKHRLDRDSIRLLGEFLCKILDVLYRTNIVHNDLRDTNIMVVTDQNGRVEKYLLIDFGAASIDGKPPWESDTYEGRYLIRNVCGDYRYNEFISDDAASAMLIYSEAGGMPDDEAARILRSKIGRVYFSYIVN